MQKIPIILITIIFSSCSSLIVNRGYKNYKSEIVKTSKYKQSNKFQQDLLYLDDLCSNSFQNIDSVFPKYRRQLVVDSLMRLLSNENIDPQIFSGSLFLYLSYFENQHTRLETSGLQSKVLFPYMLYFVNDDWYLININKGYDSLLIGKKVIELNDEPFKKVEKKLSKYVFAENEICQRNEMIRLINRADLLKQWGVIRQADSISLSFEAGNKIWVKSVIHDRDVQFYLSDKNFSPNLVTKYVNHFYNIVLYPKENYAYFQFNKCHDQIEVSENIGEYLKSWVVPMARLYVNHNVRKKNQKKLRNYVDVERPIFKDYLRVMFDSIHNAGIGNIIIDLRFNGGGSPMTCLQLLYYLTDKRDLKDFNKTYTPSEFQRQKDRRKYDCFVKTYQSKAKTNPKGIAYSDGFKDCDSSLFEKIENVKSAYFIPKNRNVFKGKIIVLANYETGSAAALFTTLLQDNNIATIIGTSVSNNPIGASGLGHFKLPNSKYTGSVATDYFIRPTPAKGKIQNPDYWIENYIDDLMTGKDKLLEKSIELIKNQ